MAHDLRQHNEYFIADEVAKVVIDLFEMINIANRQPVICRASPVAALTAVRHFAIEATH